MGKDKIWKAIRVSNSGFGVDDIVLLTGCSKSLCRKMLRKLELAGFLSAEKMGRKKVYRLEKDSIKTPNIKDEKTETIIETPEFFEELERVMGI